MRIRLPFAGAFLFLTAVAAYAGLSTLQITTHIDDKLLHFLTFFILTTLFYWILDTSRRRSLNLTLLVCTGFLSIGSEFLQDFLDNNRVFDFYDIVANVIGSLGALGLSSWYHMRMLERKRLAKNYHAIPRGDGDIDLELGESMGVDGEGQESGVVSSGVRQTMEEEVDNWDENMDDNWDENGHVSDESEGPKTPSASSSGEAENANKMAK